MADTGPLVRYDVLGRPIKSTGDSFLDDALAEAREDREQRGIIRDWDWISDRVSELYEVAKGDPVALRYVHTGNVEDYATNVAVKILAEGGWTKDVDTAELVETTIRAGGWIQRNDLDEEVEEKVKAGCAVLSTKLTTDLNREKRRLHIQNVRRITTFTRSMGIMLVSLIIPFTHAIYPPAAPYVGLPLMAWFAVIAFRLHKRFKQDIANSVRKAELQRVEKETKDKEDWPD